MIEKILKVINEFLEFGSKYLTLYPNQDMDDSLKKFIRNYNEDYIEKLKSITEHTKINTLGDFSEVMKEFIESMKPSELGKLVLENLKSYRDNWELIFFLSPFFEKKLYEGINPIFKDFSKKYYDGIIKLCDWYYQKTHDLLPINFQLKSITIINEEIRKLDENWKDTTFIEMTDYQNKIYKKIEMAEENQYKLYFQNWILNLADLIESRIKLIMLSLIYLKTLENEGVVDLFKKNNLTVGQILHELDPDKKYKNIRHLKIYRNSKFHSGVKIIFEKELNKKYFIFKDRNNEIKIDLNNFMIEFEKVYRMINTLDFLIIIYGIKTRTKSENPFDFYYNTIKNRLENNEFKNEINLNDQRKENS